MMDVRVTESIPEENSRMFDEYSRSFAGNDGMRHPFAVSSEELPPERLDEFSMAPFGFEESASYLWEDTQLTYQHACLSNRFSEDYLKLCGRLEKNIKQVGSMCVTKAVLEQKGFVFSGLEGMNISELIGMVSFHLRKCHAAFRSVYRENNFLGMSYLNWEFRWVELGSRLKSTGVKIQNITAGSVNIDSILQRETVTPRPAGTKTASVRAPRPLPINPSALPVDGSLARQILREQRDAEKREKEYEKQLCDLYKIWGKKPEIPPELMGMVKVEPNFPMSVEKDGKRRTEFIEAEEARKILMEDAEARGDQKALEEIPSENADQLGSRWIDYLEANPGSIWHPPE